MQKKNQKLNIRKKVQSPRGMALFLVIVTIAILSALVTDMGDHEFTNYKLASQERDALQAEALAHSGLQVARLMLAAQGAVQPLITQLATMGIPLPAHTFWQLIPIQSEILRGMTSGDLQMGLGMDVSAALAARQEKHNVAMAEGKATWEETRQSEENSPSVFFEPPVGGFGFFDGEFSVEIIDEEQKAVSLRRWGSMASPQQKFMVAQKLYTLMQPERYDFLFEERDPQGNRTDRFELIANILDYIDDNQEGTDPNADQNNYGRQSSGIEDTIYSSYGRVKPKNAYFDSVGELRRIRGMSDAVLRAFGHSISIYGEEKVNILSAPQQSIEALIYACSDPGNGLLQNTTWMQETLIGWDEWKTLGPLGGGGPVTPDGFISYLTIRGLQPLSTCKGQLSTESKNFTVKSMGTVGNVTKTAKMVVRSFGPTEELYYYTLQ